MNGLRLLSPLKGWAGPLEEVPDPVFAERMMGDGLAIDPTEGRLHAPCAGVVVSLHRARHAVVVRADNGAEILVHIGLDTVALDGEGLSANVAEGDRVEAGDLLISFDLDLLARRARSLITPVVLTGEGFAIVSRTQGREVEVGDELMRIEPTATAAAAAGEAATAQQAHRTVLVPLAHGLHARPAARLAQAAGRFAAVVSLEAKGRSANARSAVALMSLGLARGDAVEIIAAGADADAAVQALAGFIEAGLGEAEGDAPTAPAPASRVEPAEAGTIGGVRASPGLAVGVVVRLRPPQYDPPEAGQGTAHEADALAAAQAAVRSRLTAASGRGGGAGREILEAHLSMLIDPELGAEAQALIARGHSAGFAWRAAIARHVEILRALGPGRFAERCGDLLDLDRQVLAELSGAPLAAPDIPERAIVVAEELLPSELSQLDPTRLAGFVTSAGGPTSHVAIIATGLGIPALVAAGAAVFDLPEGAEVILDADAGRLHAAPGIDAITAARFEMDRRAARRAAARAGAEAEARMADGTRIEVFANVGSAAEARTARENGAEGCGLLRTEFLFLDRAEAPTEDEQHAAYQEIAEILGGRPMVVRTLDIGSDKPAAYLSLPHEENPALGLRGVRVGLARPDLLRAQLRAILRVQPQGQCRIMLPMVSDASEMRAVRAILDEERAALGADVVELGANIETPAAAVAADLIAVDADFLSIGTNDLTQYTLAMDRGHPALAAGQDAMHPAVLRLIASTARGAESRGRWLGVCGGLASDLAAIPILIGLGVTELSAAAGVVAEVKAVVRTLTMERCRALAAEAVTLGGAAAVRALAARGVAADRTETAA
jgi:multiphosphoryl transfer protein